MNRVSASPNAWHPQTKEDREAILRELKKVLASPQFSSSKRYPALLQYTVEKTLEGKSDLLKERTLGVDVFDRHPAYDTNTDTVVRYTAGEVRKRLMLYYHELDHKPVIQISLPPGSYVPEFIHSPDEPRDPASLTIPDSPGFDMAMPWPGESDPHAPGLVPALSYRPEVHAAAPARRR